MNGKENIILEKFKGKKTGVFIDGANLFHSYKENGWQIDLGKLKIFFSNYCDLKFINYYLTTPTKNDISFHSSQKFLEKVKNIVNIKSKELKYIQVGGQVVKKGNMDVEIILDVVRNINNLDIVIIASGDSDFLELKNYIVNEHKKIILFAGYEKNMSWELRQCWHIYFDGIKELVALK